tara:strand:- start:429 stop:701 length:273 start_codon:yes stop_codon:yes gene_type:complete
MALKSSRKFFDIGPFAEHLDSIADFGANIYLSYAILELFQKQKALEKMYLNALALDDEQSMILYKKELEALRSSFSTTLITAFSDMPEIS